MKKKYTQILRVHRGIDFTYYEMESGLVNGIKMIMFLFSMFLIPLVLEAFYSWIVR